MTEQKIAVLGADPVGVVISALLTKRGIMIDLIGAESDSVKAMQQQKTMITGSLDIHIPVSTYTTDQISGPYDIVFLMSSPGEIREKIEKITPCLHEESVICALFGTADEAAAFEELESKQLIAGVVSIDAEWLGPGIVRCTSSARHLVYDHLFELGEFDGRITPRLLKVQKILEKVGACSASYAFFENAKQGRGRIKMAIRA